ncbi:hypothetical protein CP965_13855 [Halarcobacter mediterraneus]|uniref:Sensory/regulatory protein RpfC n=1 Tax=Halarcobacter mediterraneus TaxID=2023153 RepID=A0A4Q1AQ25_9BACT|nr:ATP-binding protein [Halarcobacter mediterraneus]RXK11454.1 hypothetical protein CP965_13855 [Halarcobacter mediterraneus]
MKNSVLKSLIALLAVFLIGYSSLVVVHIFFAKIIDDLDNEVKNEQARYKIGEYILKEINSVERNYYQMAIVSNTKALTPLQDEVIEELNDIRNAINILEKGGTLDNYIKLNLVGISETVEQITFSPSRDTKYTFESIDLKPKLKFIESQLAKMKKIIVMKNIMETSNNKEDKEDAKFEIQMFFKQIPALFIRMKENASRLLYESKINLDKLEKNILKEKKYYSNLEFVVTFLVMFLVSILSYIVIKLILKKSGELKAISLKAENAAKEASKANKIKSQFLANMSHEIRTPLNAIIGFSEILSKAKLSIKEKEQASVINKSAKSLLNIINDILDISKVESGKFELSKGKVDLKKLLEQVVELYSINTKQKNIRFIYKLIGDIPRYIYTDETRLKQVLSNIVSNAIKFTPENKKVFFEVELLKQDEKEATLKFLVKDEGIGISLENQKRIFKPFSQADGSISRQFGGTGLGLSISLKIIELMGSKINLLSEENKGSSFFFDVSFPYEKAKEKNKQYKFLVCNSIDNKESIKESLLNILKEYGEIFDEKTIQGTINLIFCFEDINLSEKLEKLVSKFDVPIVFVGNSENLEKTSKINSLIDFYLDTPIYGSKVFNIIAQACKIENQRINAEIKKDNTFRGKVLVAEDNANNQLLIELLLKDLGLSIDIVDDGQKAYDLYIQNDYDIVFLDINMPIMDGLKALELIREYELKNKIKNIPIIALTANTIKGDKEKYLEAGMNDYLAKPIENDKLIEVLKKYLSKSFSKKVNLENIERSKNTFNKIDLNLVSTNLGLSQTIAQKVIDKFKADISKELDEFEKTIEVGDEEEIIKKAHYIKNSCLNLCLTQICELLEEIEKEELSSNQKKEKFKILKEKVLELL